MNVWTQIELDNSDLGWYFREKLDDLFIQKRNIGDELQCLQQELAEKDKELESKHKEFHVFIFVFFIRNLCRYNLP